MSESNSEIGEFFERNATKITRICAAALSRRPVPHLEPGDVFSAVYLKARNGGHLNGCDESTAYARIKVMARSCVTDGRRKMRATDPLDGAYERASTAPSPYDLYLLQEQAQRVQSALSRLKPSHRAAIDAVDFQGLSYAEIAAESGEPVSTIGCRLMRARQAFAAVYTANTAH